MKVDVYNLNGDKVGNQDVSDVVFGAPWRQSLVHQVMTAQLDNRRRPWAHTKGRGDVSGGGRKPWKQKGTGRARHGSIRSPIWIGGGKAHGPTSEKDYSKKVNKKTRRAALFSVLSRKLKDKEVVFFESIEFSEPKTKIAFDSIKKALDIEKNNKTMDTILVTMPGDDSSVVNRAARNLVKTKTLPADSLNIVDLLSYKNVMIDVRALPVIEETYSVSASKTKRETVKTT